MSSRLPAAEKERRIQFLRDAVDVGFRGNNAALGRALKFKDGSLIGQWLRGERPITEDTLRALTSLPEVRGAIQTGKLDSATVAHPMSLERLETVPSLTLEQLVMRDTKELPATFRLPIEKAEMSPRVKPGAWAQFSSTLANDARPGDGVLVQDATGGVHFRVYRAGRPGTWEAHADNPDYEPLVSDRDGLKVLAVLTAIEGRWS